MSNSLIKGIHHISMKCNEHEIDEVIHFYKDILELDIYNEWDTGIMFDELEPHTRQLIYELGSFLIFWEKII